MKYIIDTTNNGYILTAKAYNEDGSVVRNSEQLVFLDLQSLFEEVARREAEQGR